MRGEERRVRGELLRQRERFSVESPQPIHWLVVRFVGWLQCIAHLHFEIRRDGHQTTIEGAVVQRIEAKTGAAGERSCRVGLVMDVGLASIHFTPM
jgi:hypothetical protein